MKHILITRFNFHDERLNRREWMDWYVKMAAEYLIPQLNKQTTQDFLWAIIRNNVHDDYVNKHFSDYPFKSFDSVTQCVNFCKENDILIQTRHDIDDWMREDYIETIQQVCEMTKFDKLLIHTNPIIHDYFTKQEFPIEAYGAHSTSSFVTMYQKALDCDYHVLMDEHTKLVNYISNVVTLPTIYCKQVKHGKNLSGGYK